MEKNKLYISLIQEADKIAEANLNNPTSLQRTANTRQALIDKLEKDSYIKIPFVGDFSAGKSSLLNCLMNCNLLPTNIAPETAVSYELYYTEQEALQVWHQGQLKETATLSDISSLKVVPGDVVHVYIQNGWVKQMNERGIVIVDMPGIDSGIEAHNNAILNYIQEGTYFIVLVDAEQGTLRESTLSFIEELKKYNLSMSVMISKADKKPESEIASIRNLIEKQAKRRIGNDARVGVTSAATGNTQDIRHILDALDVDEFIRQKYEPQVRAFIEGIAAELQLQINLVLSDKKDFARKIAQLQEEKEKALENLQQRNREAQPVNESAEDILNDIRDAILAKSSYLANVLYSSGNDSKQFEAELLNIIRPILVNSFKREISEYQETLGNSIQEFMSNVDGILQEGNQKLIDSLSGIAGETIGSGMEKLLQGGLDKLMTRFVAYKSITTLLGTATRFITPLVSIVINFLPDILHMIFGPSKEKQIEKIQGKLENELLDKILNSLRQEIIGMLEGQRQEALQSLESLIQEESRKYDDNISQIQQEQQADEETVAATVNRLQEAIEALQEVEHQM